MVTMGNTDAAARAVLKVPPLRVMLGLGARFVCLLALLLAPWPGVGEAYGALATHYGNALIAPFSSPRVEVVFTAPDAAPGAEPTPFATVLRVRELSTRRGLRIPFELRTLAFIPTAAFIALVLADTKRRNWRTRAWQLLLGVGVLHLFLSVSLAVPLFLFFAEPKPLQLLPLNAGVYWTLTWFYRSLVAPPGMIYAVPLALWLLLRASVGPARTRDAGSSSSLNTLPMIQRTAQAQHTADNHRDTPTRS